MKKSGLLADLHMHSRFSDGKLSIPELVDLYGGLGFDVIAITDHLCEESTWLGVAAQVLARTLTPANFSDYLRTLEREANRAWREYRMLVIPGFELTKNRISNSRSAHVLGIGIREYIPADLDPGTLAQAIRDQNGVSIAAHPVFTRKFEKQTFRLWDRRDELSPLFDAWEVASGPHLFPEVLQSKLPMVASSDLHAPTQMRSWKTILHCDRDPAAALDAIRKQNLSIRFFDPSKSAPADPWGPFPVVPPALAATA